MLKGYYAKEPFDARLAVLRLFRNLHRIALITVLGMLLFGGGYYIKNILLQGDKQYCAVSVYKAEYADLQWYPNGTYINYMTWDTWVNTKEIKDIIQNYLGEEYGKAEVTVSAAVDSDLRVPSTKVISVSPEYSLAYAQALEKALVNDFPRLNPNEVSEIRVIDPASEAAEIHPDVRPLRAFLLSGILTLFFALTVFFLIEWGEDSIWLPATLYKRYGLQTLDTIQKQGFETDLAYYFEGKQRIAVCSVDAEVDTGEVCGFLRERQESVEWIPFLGILTDRQVCGKLKESDAVLLVVRAGHHAGKPLEYVLQILDQHKCEITCAMLWGTDEKMVRSYYRFSAGLEEEKAAAGGQK